MKKLLLIILCLGLLGCVTMCFAQDAITKTSLQESGGGVILEISSNSVTVAESYLSGVYVPKPVIYVIEDETKIISKIPGVKSLEEVIAGDSINIEYKIQNEKLVAINIEIYETPLEFLYYNHRELFDSYMNAYASKRNLARHRHPQDSNNYEIRLR
ncbi:MAG: hypothetical protein ABIA97_02860 [Candidatus Omnitrophota bacterium]